MKAAAFCIKHRVTTIMACIMIVIFGVMGFSSLPLAMLPNIEMPMAIVYATYAGAGPEEIETLVTKPLESACASVAGLDTLDSQSSENMSMLMITFADGTDMDEALTSLREKIDQAKGVLPKDATSPTVMKLDVDAMPIVSIGLRGADLAQLQQIAEDDITPAMERIGGVAQVQIFGGFGHEVAIYTHADKLNGYGLSISYISQILTAENVAIPAGDVQNGSQTLAVRTTGEFASADDIANVLLPLPTGGTVRLGEIADISIQPTEQDAIAKMGTDMGVVLSVMKQSDVNTVQVANRIHDQLEEMTEENPTLEWEMLFDQSDYIRQSVDDVISNILLGVLLTAIVLMLFLRDFGATMVISLSMPVCIVSVFLIMSRLDITMNMMSLGGLSIGVGLIVDNSITVLENIFRWRSDGYSRWDACIQGTGEVGISVMAGTLTTIAVFLPIGLSNGLAGMMFREFSLTISSLLLASMFVSLMLVPLLCYLLLDRGAKQKKKKRRWGRKKKTADEEEAGEDAAASPAAALPAGAAAESKKASAVVLTQEGRLMRGYKGLLHYFITHRKVAMLVSAGLMVLFFTSIIIAGFEMMPESDQGQVSIAVSMPVGAEIEDTAAICDRITSIAEETIPELESSYYTTGGGGMMSGDNAVVLDIGSKNDRDRGVKEIVATLREDLSDIAGCELTVTASGTMDMSSMTGKAISITLRGDDYDQLTEASNRLASSIAALEDAVDVKSSAADQTPQVDITLDRTAASRFGLNAATLGQAVRSELTGTAATKLKISGEEITVSVKGDSRSGASLDALRAIAVPTPTGGSVPLGAVAEVSVVLAPQQISRHNQSRTVTVTGDSKSDDVVGISQSVDALIKDFSLPEGVTIESGGEMQEMMDSFVSLAKAFLASILLIYFVLASQFESFLLPAIVMMVLPVSLVGSLTALPLMGQKISVVAFIGVIMLIGTAIGAAIVLVDYIIILRERGETKEGAIMKACPRRIRPVLITAITSTIGMIPMAISTGEGAEMMRPMAFVMIMGMIISTIVTLLFTPVYYSLLDSLAQKFQRKKDDGDDSDEAMPMVSAPTEEAAHV